MHTTTFRAMASGIDLLTPVESQEAAAIAMAVFASYENACSRFLATSDLSLVNEDPTKWSTVGPEYLSVLQAAYAAYGRTGGLFDPRVLSDLVDAGYDRTFLALPDRLEGRPTDFSTLPTSGSPHRDPWVLSLDGTRVCVGPWPLDFGGIAKGYTVDVAVAALRASGRLGDDFALNAGGDGYFSGRYDNNELWPVGIDDPFSEGLSAVVSVTDCAIATSSLLGRRWTKGGVSQHHVIDPTTRAPAATSLVSVTVLGATTQEAEVTAKCVLLQPDPLRYANEQQIAAVCVDVTGKLLVSETAEPYVTWRAPSYQGPVLRVSDPFGFIVSLSASGQVER